MAKQSGLGRGDYRIVDPQALARLIRDHVATEHGGNLKAAYDAVRNHGSGRRRGPPLSYAQLSKLRNGRTRSISREALDFLELLLPKGLHRSIEGALLTEEMKRAIRVYRAWLRRARPRLDLGLFLHLPGSTALRGSRRRRPRPEQREEFWEALRLLKREWTTQYATELRPLQAALRRCRVAQARIELIWWRMLAPVLAGNVTRIERGWGELNPAERLRFVKASVQRECVMLNREEDYARAQLPRLKRIPRPDVPLRHWPFSRSPYDGVY